MPSYIGALLLAVSLKGLPHAEELGSMTRIDSLKLVCKCLVLCYPCGNCTTLGINLCTTIVRIPLILRITFDRF